MTFQQSKNLAFILSTPRAGSTLLSSILGSHSNVFCPPELWLLLPLSAIAPEKSLIFSAYDQAAAQKVWFNWYDETMFSNASAAFATNVYEKMLSDSTKQIIIDKTPRYYHILPYLEQMFPESPKIWIKRNPLDVIASHRTTWNTSFNLLVGQDVGPVSFDYTVSFFLLYSYFQKPSPAKHVVKYEELVAEPDERVKEICQFLNIEMEETMLSFAKNEKLLQQYSKAEIGDKKILHTKGVHTKSVGNWRNALSPEEVKRILVTLGKDLFIKLGYLDNYNQAAEWAGVKPEDENSEIMNNIFQAYSEFVSMGSSRNTGVDQNDAIDSLNQLRMRLAESEATRQRYKALLNGVISSKFYKTMSYFGLWKWLKL